MSSLAVLVMVALKGEMHDIFILSNCFFCFIAPDAFLIYLVYITVLYSILASSILLIVVILFFLLICPVHFFLTVQLFMQKN